MNTPMGRFHHLAAAFWRTLSLPKLLVSAFGLYCAGFLFYFIHFHAGPFLGGGVPGALLSLVGFLSSYLILVFTALVITRMCRDEEENHPPGPMVRWAGFFRAHAAGLLFLGVVAGGVIFLVAGTLVLILLPGRIDAIGAAYLAGITFPLILILAALAASLLLGLFLLPPILIMGPSDPFRIVADVRWLFGLGTRKLLWLEFLAAAFAVLGTLPLALLAWGVRGLAFDLMARVTGVDVARLDGEFARLTLNSSQILLGAAVFAFAYAFQVTSSFILCRRLPEDRDLIEAAQARDAGGHEQPPDFDEL
ncbi:MAG: hypothetical protein V1809_07170 [Planctomycetota bacterium]